jgi:hypothetical protein
MPEFKVPGDIQAATSCGDGAVETELGEARVTVMNVGVTDAMVINEAGDFNGIS